MANISKELAAIMEAVYGQDVRSSIHDAIEKINDVSEVVLTTGTEIDSPTASSKGFYESSLYLNTETMILWKCIGTNSWENIGTLKGMQGDPGNKWYRGTEVSASALVNVGLQANVNDNYLNKDEGKIYHCIGINPDGTTNWSYDMTLSGGGGGGGASDWSELDNKPFDTLGDDFTKDIRNRLTLSDEVKESIDAIPNLVANNVAETFAYEQWNNLSDKTPYIGKRITIKDYYSSICQTVTECLDSESNDDVVGASALKELTSYSTDEKKIGKWIDGTTDLYTKTFYKEHTRSGGGESAIIAPFDVSNLSIKNIKGSLHHTVNNAYTGLNFYSNSTNWASFVASSSKELRITFGETFWINTNVEILVTLEYTKN